MKNHPLPLALLLALTLPAAAQSTAPATPSAAWPDHRRVLPERLRRVPVGLSLHHSPNPVYPEPEAPGRFAWKHSTTVVADVADLEIVECGSFIWYDERGWQANIQLSPAQFAELFNCPGGRLRRGQAYVFPKNYRFASAEGLYGGDALWYVLARDQNGQLYKGTGLIETEGKR